MSGIHSVDQSLYRLTQYNSGLLDTQPVTKDSSHLNMDADTLMAGKTRTPRQTQAYTNAGGLNSDVGKAALNRALKEMQGMVDGPITFDKIYEYRDYLETKFTVETKVEMTKRGVDPEQEFTIVMGADGDISVACDDPATKEAVLQYLKETPEACEEFGYIQALGNLQRAQQTAAWPSVQVTKATLVNSAIEAMFDETLSSGAMVFSSLTAQFSGLGEHNSASFYTGVNFAV